MGISDQFHAHKEELANQSEGLKKGGKKHTQSGVFFTRGYCGWMGHADFLTPHLHCRESGK